jgi:hypothetical protein
LNVRKFYFKKTAFLDLNHTLKSQNQHEEKSAKKWDRGRGGGVGEGGHGSNQELLEQTFGDRKINWQKGRRPTTQTAILFDVKLLSPCGVYKFIFVKKIQNCCVLP